MKSIFLSLVLLFTIFISACKKDVVNENDNSIVNVIIDSPYLSKIYWIDYSSSASIKTLTRTYKYDINKRVIAFYDSTQYGETAKALYSYNNNEIVPFKSVYAVYNPFPRHYKNWGFIDTTFFFYSNNKRIYDSVIKVAVIQTAGIGKTNIVKNYSFGLNKIFAVGSEKQFYTNGSIIDQYVTKDTAYTSANGVVDSSISYFREITNATPLKDTIRTFYKYDNKISPFSILSNNIAGDIFVTKGFYNHEIYFDQFIQVNNKVSSLILRKTSGTANYAQFREDYVGKYYYKSNGQPNTIDDVGLNNFQLLYRIKFSYTNL